MEFLRKYGILFLVLAILFPSAVSLTHIYAHDAQEHCIEDGQPHFHKKNIDCELCDLRSSSFFTFSPFNPQLFQPEYLDKRFFNHYQFLSDYQKLPFGLRAPPAA